MVSRSVLPTFTMGDALKLVLNLRHELAESVAGVFMEQLVTIVVDEGVNPAHLDALLFRTAVIVFVLYLQERVATIEIGADTHFLTNETPVVMGKIHLFVGCIEINRPVRVEPIVAVCLGIVFALSHLQQLL